MAMSKNAWISRKIKILKGEGYKQDQAVAVAHSMWREKNEEKARALSKKRSKKR